MKKLNILGRPVLPLVIDSEIDVSYASSVLYGSPDMHRSCHMDWEQKNKMVEAAKRVLRNRNKEGNWRVAGLYDDGTYLLMNDYGYSQDRVSRNSFRLIKAKNGKQSRNK